MSPTWKSKATTYLRRAGVEVRRTRGFNDDHYYPMPRSCQVPHLGYLYELLLGRRQDGCFVEVGANDGVIHSNTWGLATRGWRGVMFEPIPALAQECRNNHRAHPAVEVHELAISDATGEVKLHVAGVLTSANRAQIDEYSGHEDTRDFLSSSTHIAQTETLDRALASAGVLEDFDVLVVDVEGHEASVFAGFSIPRWRPKLMIVELVDMHPRLQVVRRADFELGQAIMESEYQIVYKDSSNTVFARGDLLRRVL